MLAVGAVLADWDPAGIPRAHAAPSITNPRIAREPAPIPSDPFRNRPSDFARGPLGTRIVRRAPRMHA